MGVDLHRGAGFGRLGATLAVLAVLGPSTATLAAKPATASPADKVDKKVLRGIKRVFARMKLGVRQENELQFKHGWAPLGYEKNLVGGRAGMAGRGFYRQLKSRRWLLRPKLEQIHVVPGGEGRAYVLPCLIWSPSRKAIATVHALVIYSNKWRRWQMLGGGGRRADVQSLGRRFVAGAPELRKAL